jgi:hypothetical protein
MSSPAGHRGIFPFVLDGVPFWLRSHRSCVDRARRDLASQIVCQDAGVQAFPGPTGPVAPQRSSRVGWIVGAVVLGVVLLGVIAVALLLGGGDADDTVAEAQSRSGFETTSVDATGDDDGGGLAPAEDADDREAEAATTEAPPQTPTGEPSESTVTVTTAAGNLILDGPQGAFADLQSELGGAPLAELLLYDTYLIAEYQNPREPENIDRVIWRAGAVEPPEPVGFSEDDSMLFTADEVDLDAVPGLAGEALESIDVEGGVVSHVIVDRFFGLDDGGVAIRVYVSNPERGGGGYLLARGDGTVVRVVQ